jgi:hypothetical protein
VTTPSKLEEPPPISPVIAGSTLRMLTLGAFTKVEETPITLELGIGIQILLIGLPLVK